MIQRKGRRESYAYKVHTSNNKEDASHVWRKLGGGVRKGVSETTRPIYGLGYAATVADDLGFEAL